MDIKAGIDGVFVLLKVIKGFVKKAFRLSFDRLGAVSSVSPAYKRQKGTVCENKMLQENDVHHLQHVFDLIGHLQIAIRRHGNPARMIVRQYNARCLFEKDLV